MASGPTISADGLVTMTQVVAGTDLVSDGDFNNARTNVDRLLGTANDITLGTYDPTFTYGYGQGGVGVGAASAGADILATGANGAFADLQDDVQALCAFLGLSLRAGVGTDVTSSTTITAATWNNLMLNIQDCWNTRFDPSGGLSSTTETATRTTSWTNTLEQVMTWSFANENDCRAWFNLGSFFNLTISRTGGTSSSQNTSWSNAFSNMGAIVIAHDGSGPGSPTSPPGFYNLTTSYQTLYSDTSAGSSPYNNDSILIEASVNSTTNPTEVYLRTTLTDAGDNSIDASVDGTLTIQSSRVIWDSGAAAAGFTIPTVTGTAGPITGS